MMSQQNVSKWFYLNVEDSRLRALDSRRLDPAHVPLRDKDSMFTFTERVVSDSSDFTLDPSQTFPAELPSVSVSGTM